jgi:dTDP-4-amino-4,6-dideoxygalactose transaminase
LIPFLNLAAQYASIRDEIDSAVGDVLDSHEYILGSFVHEFEQAFAAYCAARHAIAVNSGTSALHLALLANGVTTGDEVITVAFTFVATIAAIRYCNAHEVYVDIDPRTFNMAASAIEQAITPKTKAILPVHLYGQPADMDAINAIAKQHNLRVVEDAAQAHGAEYKGKRVGTLGDAGCFSFYPTKNLGACGEGGMVTTNDDEIAHQVRLLRDWGSDRKYHHVMAGFNYRMEGLQGAILNVKLRHLEEWTERRREVAAMYDELLTVEQPHAISDTRHVYHTYTIRSHERDILQQRLRTRGIQTAIHYPVPIHLQPAYTNDRHPKGSLPESERAANEVLSLPMYPELTQDEVSEVAEACRGRWLGKTGIGSG